MSKFPSDAFSHEFRHPHPPPGPLQVESFASPRRRVLMFDLQSVPKQRLGDMADHSLDQVRHRLPGAERLVCLEHRELGVVARTDPFVAEIAVQLEDFA